MPRMRILTVQEQERFDHTPVFDYAQRKQFFNFPNMLIDRAKTLRTPSSQVGFLLMSGYFKATKLWISTYVILKLPPISLAIV